MPTWFLTTRPPTVSRERWHSMSKGERRAAVKVYWHGLSLETQHMLTLKGSESVSIDRGGI